jgi:hypothetical protein
MTHIPETLFNTSFLYDASGRWREFADYFIAKTPILVNFKAQFEESLLQNLEFSIAVSLAAIIIMISINKCLGKSLSDSKELISGHDQNANPS